MNKINKTVFIQHRIYFMNTGGYRLTTSTNNKRISSHWLQITSSLQKQFTVFT